LPRSLAEAAEFEVGHLLQAVAEFFGAFRFEADH
jgi:hypothetical protein